MTAGYRPRRCAPLASIAAGGMRLKRVWIDLHGAAAPPAPLGDAAWATAAAVVPEAAAAEGGAAGLGFAILHRGEAGNWLLMHWWAHGDICCQRLAHAPHDGPGFRDLSDRPLMACVWELPVIAAERAAWIDTMMTGTPDPDGYVARTIAEGWV